MGPIGEGIIIGIGSTAGVGIITMVGTTLARVWKTPKRLDRIERLVPILLRGMWAVLKMHVDEQNGSTDPDIKRAFSELTEIVTDGAVSQKGNL